MAGWFYSREGQTLGPFSVEEVKERAAKGLLHEEDLVWPEGSDCKEGMCARAALDFSCLSKGTSLLPDWLEDVAKSDTGGLLQPTPSSQIVPDWLKDLQPEDTARGTSCESPVSRPPTPARVRSEGQRAKVKRSRCGEVSFIPKSESSKRLLCLCCGNYLTDCQPSLPPVVPDSEAGAGPLLPEQSPSDPSHKFAWAIAIVVWFVATIGFLLFTLIDPDGSKRLVQVGSVPDAGPPAETKPATTRTPPALTPQEVNPASREMTTPLPVYTSRNLSETARKLERGKRVIVTGMVKALGTTGLNQRLFWEVPEGLGSASLSDDLEEAQAQVVCVFRGGRPESLEEGVSCRIEGTFRGVNPISGVPLLVDCELATEGR